MDRLNECSRAQQSLLQHDSLDPMQILDASLV